MTIEDKLKEFILEKYSSIREFTLAIDMPYSTLDSIFRRGIYNASLANILKICKKLGISADALAAGEIQAYTEMQENNDSTEVNDMLDDVKNQLLNDPSLTIDGKAAETDTIKHLVNLLDVALVIAEHKTAVKNGIRTVNTTVNKK